MKISLMNVVMFSAGVILMYSGITDKDPRDVIKEGLGGPKAKKYVKPDHGAVAPAPGNPDPGQRHPGDKFYDDGLSPASVTSV